MMIRPGCTNFRGSFSEVVIAHFVFNMFGKNMQSLSAAFYKSRLKSTFGGTSRKIDFAHILHKDRS